MKQLVELYKKEKNNAKFYIKRGDHDDEATKH